jgi:hypothetical protein
MPYPPDSVVDSFGTDAYRVEFRSTGTDVVPRVIHRQTGREVATTELDAGLQLRIKDEQSKAVELMKNEQPKPEPEATHSDKFWDEHLHRVACDALRQRQAAAVQQRDATFGRDRDR